MTVIELIKAAAYQANMTFVPTTISAATDKSSLQLLHLFYETGRDLRASRWWPQLKKKWSITLQGGRKFYQLPQDFYASLPGTHWDQQNKWEMLGPTPDTVWNYREYGYVTLENRKSFRVFGPDINVNSGAGQLEINPTPGEDLTGVVITFEYLSRSWILPPSWAASTSYTSGAYVNSAGNVYLYSSGSTSGANPPNMANGRGLDGGVFWTAISVSSWGSTTAYAAGTYVANGGNLYQCSAGGISGGTGPVGTDEDTDETDGTVTWRYKTYTSGWTAQTEFSQGDHLKISSQYYICSNTGNQGENSQKTGNVQPTWTASTVSDGGVVWTYVGDAYETARTDNDLVLFDDELMIAGLKWQFLRARGLKYEDIRADYERMKTQAAARWMPGMKVILGGSDYTLAGLNPNLREGGFG